MTNPQELLPCPFCGSSDIRQHTKPAFFGGYMGYFWCGECNAQTASQFINDADNISEILKAWNTRQGATNGSP